MSDSMARRPTAKTVRCFISFCVADGNAEELTVLLEELKKLTRDNVQYLSSHELPLGETVAAHESALEHAEAIIIVGTPEYKRRIDMRELQSGVSREFQIYVRRNDEWSGRNHILAIKIVWKGTFETALPAHFESRERSIDLSKFYTYHTDQGRRLTAASTKHVAGAIKLIADRLLALQQITVGEERRRQSYHDFDIAFFKLQKHERETYERFREDLFVKTRQFLRVASQEDYLLIGRKGVGKTTLISIMEKNQAFAAPIELVVDRWDVHGVGLTEYSQKASGDFVYLHRNKYEAFSLLWSAFIYLELLRAERHLLPAAEVLVRREAEELLQVRPTEGRAAEFTATSGLVSEFIRQTVERAPSDSRARFDSFLQRNLDIDSLLEWISDGSRQLQANLTSIASHSHLLCLDGFDSEFQRARNDARQASEANRQVVVKTEVDWLTALIEVIEAIKRPSGRAGRRTLGRLRSLTIVAAVPKDRFLEVQLDRRDSVLAAPTRELRWSGIELVSLLRKRIEVAGRFDTEDLKDEGANPQKRLKEGMEIFAPELNVSVNVHVSGKAFEFDLFLEVLRHTLWRPRDILIHYAELLAVLKDNRRLRRNTMPSVLGMVIARTNNLIIEHEWLGEMREHITNIDQIIRLFQNGNQQLEYDAVIERLSHLPFTFMHRQTEVSDQAKLAMLYELGFFGVRRRRLDVGNRHKMRDLFYHIYPEALDFDEKDLGKSAWIVIHPMFIEKLNLLPNVDEPVMNFSWSDIDKHDAAGG
ncbi:P-loop ATPase, Sll1717 family [Bradyrhizobium sp. Ec3.3]|uniref:P-loop ATPase, Sll1717 family n=1 Tax=Bradyrhizobium sp. Ec3.3 TaxID=189753 RepID=UPI000484535D|nr:hypothetical protein [Bradyrhizobium sp. Ec3.3]